MHFIRPVLKTRGIIALPGDEGTDIIAVIEVIFMVYD